MSKRKYRASLELQQIANIDAVTAGYLGLAAKSDGIYIKTSAGVEGRILTTLPLATLQATKTAAGYFTFASTPVDCDSYSAKFRIVITSSASTSIKQELIVSILGNNNTTPSIHIENTNLTGSAASSGLRYLRFAYPSTLHNGAKAVFDIYTYNATSRDITIELLESNNVTLEDNLNTSQYNASVHLTYTTSSLYTTSGTYCYFVGTLAGNASSATYASSMYTASFVAGESLVANDIMFLQTDGKWYKATDAGKVIPNGVRIARCASTYSLNSSVGAYYYGTYVLVAGVSGIRNPYKDVFIKTTNVAGVLTTTGEITTELEAGYTYVRIGSTTNSGDSIAYDDNNRVFQIETPGVLTTLDGLKFDSELLDGQHGSFYLDYNNLSNKPVSFPPAAHNHDERYFTEAESDSRYPVLVAGLIPSAYLPGYVDDVIEVANNPSLPANGETGKIYVTLDDNKTYRWSGSYYVEISASLALGETAATAYRGDRGKIAYDHSQILGGTSVHVSDTERNNWNLAYSWGNHSGLYQLVDADLTAIAALNTTGYLRRTGAGAWQLDTTAGGDNYEGWNVLVNTALMGYIPSKNSATTYAGGLNLIAGNNISLTPASGTNNRLQITFDTYVSSNMVTLGSDLALSINTWTDALTISLPSSGTYWIQAKLFAAITGNTTVFFRLAIGTTYYDYTVLPSEAPTGTGTGTNTATLMALLSVAGASTLKVQYYTANSGITLKSSQTIGGVTATGLTKLGYLKTY